MAECVFCGGACGRVCRGLGFKRGRESKPAVPRVPALKAAARGRKSESGEVETQRAGALSAGSIPASPVRSPGRPKAGEEPAAIAARKPWEALGVSRRTWYRMGRPGADDGDKVLMRGIVGRVGTARARELLEEVAADADKRR